MDSHTSNVDDVHLRHVLKITKQKYRYRSQAPMEKYPLINSKNKYLQKINS